MVVGELAESTEVLVIGAGPGGYVAAIRAAQLGKEVTLISKDPLPGGECLLRGCIPSKALIEAGNLFLKIQNAKELGIEIQGTRLDFSATQKWKDNIVQKLCKGVKQLLTQNGVKYLIGEAKFLNEHNVEIRTSSGNQRFNFQDAIIATGSSSAPLKGFAFNGTTVLSSKDALNLEGIPQSLLVIGGGYIGLELGEVYAKLGTKVTLAEATEDLLPGVDPDLKRPLKKKLKELNIEILLETFARSFQAGPQGVMVELEGKDGNKKLEVTKILVAVGRVPFTKELGLENTSVQLDNKGFIKVNSRGQTSSPHLYAIGDVCGGMMLAHKASREGIVAATNIAGKADAFDNLVPAVIFTDPEIAYVGLSEEEAKTRNLDIVTGMFSFGINGRAMTLNETEGFIKVVAEKSTRRIIGVQMVGPHVSDLVSEATLGMEIGATLEDFALTIHPHPSLSEVLHEAMESALGMPIHRYQKR
jgi:dihydrolipoyl dehydrogenase